MDDLSTHETGGAGRQTFETILLPSLRRETLATRVATILKRHILIEDLQPGSRLPSERQLAETLSVSRTVLREALSQLIGEGLIERRTPRALCVARFDRSRLTADLAAVPSRDSEIRDLIELRVIIELGAIEAIVDRATDDGLQQIERWVIDGEERLARQQSTILADIRFHAALLQTLGNAAVSSLLPLIEENMRQNVIFDAHQLHGSGTPDDHRVMTDHRRIYEAIKRRDTATARLLMLAHLNPYLSSERYTQTASVSAAPSPEAPLAV